MTTKFQIGDIISSIRFPENQWEILDIIEDSAKWVKGNWLFGGSEEVLVNPNSYVLKDPKINKLSWGYIKNMETYYQLFQPVKDELLKYKQYEEILV